MLSIRLSIKSVSLTALSLLACINEEVVEHQKESPSSLRAPSAITTAQSFPITWSPSPDFSPTHAAFKVSEIVLDRRIDASSFQTSYSRRQEDGRPSDSDIWDEAPLASEPQLHIKYHARFNDLRVSNRRLQEIVDGPDVGEGRAWQRFITAFDTLVQSDLIQAKHYDLGTTKKSFTRFAIGKSEQQNEEKSTVTEYVFTVLRNLNGVRVANAGIRIAIHRCGEVSSIRLGGVTVATSMELGAQGFATSGAAEAGVFQIAVTEDAAKRRFAAEFPLAVVDWSGIMYVMPDGFDVAIIEPKFVFSYSNHTTVEGQPVASRRQMTAYSLRNPADPAENVGEEPTPDEVGDPRPHD